MSRVLFLAAASASLLAPLVRRKNSDIDQLSSTSTAPVAAVQNVHHDIAPPTNKPTGTHRNNLHISTHARQPSESSADDKPTLYADCGATDTVVRSSDAALLHDIQPPTTAVPPLRIAFGNSSTATSVAHGRLLSDLLSDLDSTAHIYADADLRANLLSISRYCNQGCKALLDSTSISIWDAQGRLLFRGDKDPSDTLWKIQPVAHDGLKPPPGLHLEPTQGTASLVIRSEFDAEFVNFFNQCFGNPTHSTALKALRNPGQLANFPRITAAMYQRNLPNSTAIPLAHLHAARQGVRSTRGTNSCS
jgi:hypothetical protein